jgi:hypothetical protein
MKVIHRNFQNKKRKRDQFQINIEEEERLEKKVRRMQDAIQALEENEKNLFGESAEKGKNRNDDDDLFNDELIIKRHNVVKATSHLHKSIVKTV